MQVSIKTAPMNIVSDDMICMQRKINICISELAQIRRELGSLSGLEESIVQIRQCEEELEIQVSYCILLGNAICQICRQYTDTEYIAIDYSEDVRRKAQRGSVGNRTLKELYSLFNTVFFTKGGD